MKHRISFVESAMKYRQIVFLVVGALIVLGFFALRNMPRQEFPTFTIRQGLVIGVYPGATSAQVEQQLTTEVEKYLFSYKEVKRNKTYSYSRDGLMITFVELNDNVTNSEEFWSKLKHGLNNLKSQLPTGVVALMANNDFGDTSALLVALEGDNTSYRELEEHLNNLEDRLRRIESVSKLRHFGLQKEEINIYLEKNKLEKYGINSSTLLVTLFTQGYTAVGGSIENAELDIPIHISSLYKNEDDIAQQIIYTDPAGHIIRLKDVARVVREYPEPDSYIQNNGKKCVLISMEMLQGKNIVQFGEEVGEVLKQFQSELPKDVTIFRIADQPKVVNYSINNFMVELLYAILAVILVTIVLLPLRVASVAASSIPITIFISLGIMYIFGIELNTVTLAALIVVLGMIVDNSIVIVDNYMEQLDHGVSRWHASIISAKAYVKAIVSATLAISITFFPFLFTLKGTFKDFVLMFPWTVTITLGISLLVAIMVIPYLQYFFITKGFTQLDSKKKKKFNFLDAMQNFYEKVLGKAFAYPKTTLSIGILSVIIGGLLFTQVPQRLMPAAERDQFAIEIYLTQGSSLKQTTEVCDSLERILKCDSRVVSTTSFIGTSSPRFHTLYAPGIPAKNYAQFIVNTTSNEATIELLNEYSPKLSNYFPNAYARFKQLDYQPITAPVEVRISGNNLEDIRKVSKKIEQKMRENEHLNWVHSDFWEMLPTANVDINSIEANRLGINKSIIATNLAIRFEGMPMTTIWENDYPVSVKLKTESSSKTNFDDIKNEYIHSFIPGVSVPLRQIATVTPGWENGQMVRRNGMPTLTILADVKRGENVNHVFPIVKAEVEKMDLPNGVTISYGGAYESDSETLPTVLGGLLISIGIIFIILLFHFKKINLALLVLGSSSLSLLGAMIGVLLLNVEFGITSILGIVSLIGILVRNGIIMLDYAEELRVKHRMSVLDASIEAGKRRMRPIFLTSMAASMGVIPMIISHSPLWSPMGAVICFGTLTSMVLLVFVLPVVYWMIFKNAYVKPTVLGNPKKIIKPVAITVLLFLAGISSSNAQNIYTLEQSKQLAIENNIEVKNAQLEIEASKQVKKEALTNYFPKINATATSFKFQESLLQLNVPKGNLPVYNGNPATIPTATQFAYFPGFNFSLIEKGTLGAVTAIQPVFAGGRIIAGNKLAKVAVDVNSCQYILARNEVLLKTEEQYWTIISLTEKMKTVKTAEDFLDSLYKQANDAWKAGLINRNEILKVSIKKSEVKVNKLKLENGIKLANMAFCQYLGIPYDSTMVLGDNLTINQNPLSVYVNSTEAVINREEYKLLQQSVKAEELKSKMNLGKYLPEVGVGAGALYYDIMDKGTTNTMIFATIKIPISDWWGASHSIKERKYKEQIAKNNSKNNEELLNLQIQKVWNELNEAEKQIIVANETIAQAEENLKINTDNFQAGVGNISDMLEAQTLHQQSKDHLVDALKEYKIKLVTYLQVTGRYQ